MKRVVLSALFLGVLSVVGLGAPATASADDWYHGQHYTGHHLMDHGWYVDDHHDDHHVYPSSGQGYYGGGYYGGPSCGGAYYRGGYYGGSYGGYYGGQHQGHISIGGHHRGVSIHF